MKSVSKSLQEPKSSQFSEEAITRYYDVATKEKISKHLTDINDTITDDDIRNIDTYITLQGFQNNPKRNFSQAES